MAGVTNDKHILWDVVLTVNAVNLTSMVRKLEIVGTQTRHPASPMGTLKDYEMPGLFKINDIKADFWQNYATASVYQTILGLYIAQTVFNVVAKPSSAATSPTNPQWTLPCFVGDFPIISGEKGEQHMSPVSFVLGGEWSYVTA